MRCLQCGKETKLMNGDGEAYCSDCMKKRRIRNPKTYSYSCGGYIETYKTWARDKNKE